MATATAGTTVAVMIAAAAAVALSGCEVDFEPATRPAGLTEAQANFETVWDAGRYVLRKYHFDLDRQDRREGLITTLPMTGMHFFELWRKDAPRPQDFGESTLQTIYRTAEVKVRPTSPGAGTFTAQVEVRLMRSDRPTPQITSTSDAYSLFAIAGNKRKQDRLLLGEQRRRDEAADLVPLGNDRALEAKLTAEIAAAVSAARR